MKNPHSLIKITKLFIILVSGVAVFNSKSIANTIIEPIDLYDQITNLQNQSHINIVGLDKIQNENKIDTRGNTEQQIEQLLSTYNHIISRTAKGDIERIIIVNKKQKTNSQCITLPTTHHGNHYSVSATLSGDGNLWESIDMVIDTGADIVVLPESMISKLGMNNNNFKNQSMQTANGMTNAKIGSLHSIKIAGETVENVQVAFIADKLLGNNRLLGMSALNHYQINIDDQQQLITLIKN